MSDGSRALGSLVCSAVLIGLPACAEIDECTPCMRAVIAVLFARHFTGEDLDTRE